VTVRAATNCPRRSDRLQALSLLQQARAGLLATVTARKTDRASVIRLHYKRHYDDRGRRIAEQHVAVDSAGELSESFGAVRSGAQFVAEGFVDRRTPVVPIHYGPDAETLLDDDFAAGYCFHLSDRDAARPTQIGLGFRASSRKKGRVDIEGTLWIDTVSNLLRDIQFDYVGDDRPFGAPQTGGHIQFRQMGNGIVIVDRWALRLWVARPVASVDVHGSPMVRRIFYVEEAGGEVATATWADGYSWDASLGSLRALVVDDLNQTARSIVVRLRDTDYLASPDARGIVQIPHLLPGPYIALVTDEALQRLRITLPTSLSFEAERDSLIERSFSLPRDEDFVRESCLRPTNMEVGESPLSIRLVDSFGQPIANAKVDITGRDGSPNQGVSESLDTDDRGTTKSCLVFHEDDEFVITVAQAGEPPYAEAFRYRNNNITIRLNPKR
jgi:hypothetical protein